MDDLRLYWNQPELAAQLSKEEKKKITQKFFELLKNREEEKIGWRIGVTKLSLPELFAAITERQWNYKTNMEILVKRDLALTCILVLSGLRITEALELKKCQFVKSSGYVIIKDAVAKNRRIRISLPAHGNAAQFTFAIKAYLDYVPETGYIFPKATGVGIFWNRHMSRHRAYRIVKALTGPYHHHFRSACERMHKYLATLLH